MISGIYKLSFSSGLFYIGRSDDIDRRWQEHMQAFQSGTAAKRMQLEYNNWGMPKFEVIYECHPDHCDLAESAIIQYGDREYMLNTQFPRRITESEWETMCECQELLELSTCDHLRMIYKGNQRALEKSSEVYELKGQLERKQEELDQLKACGLYIGDEALEELYALREELEIQEEVSSEGWSKYEKAKQELKQLKGLTLWQRIFGWPY